jgi:hypothetical protein
MEKWRSPKITEDSARLVVLTSSRWMPEVRYGKPQCRGRYSSASERDGGLEMLGKCTNPSCSASFRSLKEGRLFRLENNPTLRSCNVTTAEYFWLCSCSTMTLHLSDDGSVIPVVLPEPFRGVPDGVALTSADREKGLLLRSVSSSLPEHLGGHGRTRLKEAHHAR